MEQFLNAPTIAVHVPLHIRLVQFFPSLVHLLWTTAIALYYHAHELITRDIEKSYANMNVSADLKSFLSEQHMEREAEFNKMVDDYFHILRFIKVENTDLIKSALASLKYNSAWKKTWQRKLRKASDLDVPLKQYWTNKNNELMDKEAALVRLGEALLKMVEKREQDSRKKQSAEDRMKWREEQARVETERRAEQEATKGMTERERNERIMDRWLSGNVWGSSSNAPAQQPADPNAEDCELD